MARDLDQLADAIRQQRAILFVGAGVSMAVGLPSWSELIGYMCTELGVDPADGLVGVAGATSYQTLAEYYRVRHGSIGPLRSWMDRHWSVEREQVRRSRIHQIIVELGFPMIYTTNYDRNLEAAFECHGRPFVKVANAKDLAKSLGGETQIIKFHGDFDDDQSLVLAESDYFDRLSFDSPLDIKFRADALGRTVLFIGYSMSDLNIRLLLYKLWQLWQMSSYARDRPPSFVFLPGRNPVQQAVLGKWGITVFESEATDPEAALLDFLEDVLEATRP